MMAFEMSLPHAKRVKQLDGLGLEDQPQDQDLWDLHAAVQKAIQDKAAAAAAEGKDEEEELAMKPEVPNAPNPQRVLEKLLTARGEVDVILDLVAFVEQQQFVGVAHMPRKASTLEDLTRERVLRLAHRKDQLKSCAARLAAGLEALQAQAEVADRFLAEVAELRQRWKLRRHAGKDAFFYIDLSLPLTVSARRAVGEQPGAQWNLIQDTNGDVCMVDKDPGGRPFVVRGWRSIHSTLQAKQRALTWHTVYQLVAHEAQSVQQGADPDGLAQTVLQLAEGARSSVATALGPDAAGAGGAGPGAMDLDDAHGAAGAGAAVEPPGQNGAVGTAALPAAGLLSMCSAVAGDVQALLGSPGFQARFKAKALELLQRGAYLRGQPLQQDQQQQQEEEGGGGSSDLGPPAAGPAAARGMAGAGASSQGVPSLLGGLLAWARHSAVVHRVEASLQQQVDSHNLHWGSASGAVGQGRQQAQQGGGPAAVGPITLRALERGGAELAQAWALEAPGCCGPALVIVCEGAVRLEGALVPARQRQGRGRAEGAGVGAGAGAEPGASLGVCRWLGKQETDRALAYALQHW